MQTSIEECETCGENTGVRLGAANQYAVRAKTPKVFYGRWRRKIAVLYENAVSRNKTVISLSGFPSQLSFKGRHGFIMPFDHGHAWKHRAQFSDPMQNSYWD